MSKIQTYVQINDRTYHPKNIIPCDAIKCIQCEKYLPLNDLKNHTNDHIPFHFTQPQQQNSNSKVQKIHLNKLLNQEQDQITVKSVLPSELPSLEIKRKNVKAPQYENKQIQINSMKDDQLNTQISDRVSFLPEQIGYGNYEEKEKERKLQFQKQIKISTQKVIVHKKFLNLYQNLKLEGLKDEHYEGEKIKHKIDEKTLLAYQVAKYESSDDEEIYRQKQNIKVDFNLKPKKPKNFCKISTIKRLQKKTQSYKKYECPECHGFYCPTCKSTIPPQFRPAKIEKGNENETTASKFRKTQN